MQEGKKQRGKRKARGRDTENPKTKIKSGRDIVHPFDDNIAS